MTDAANSRGSPSSSTATTSQGSTVTTITSTDTTSQASSVTVITSIDQASTVAFSPNATMTNTQAFIVTVTTSTSSASPTVQTSDNKTTYSSADDRLSDPTVAGVVIAASVVLALITFLITYFVMRRQGRHGRSPGRHLLAPTVVKDQITEHRGPRQSFEKETERDHPIFQMSLPQSADDAAIQQKTKIVMDQIELHVENFYQDRPNFATSQPDAELAAFDSRCLPATLATLLPQSKFGASLIKHSLAHLITTSISSSGNPQQSLLPAEFVQLPSSIASTNPKITGTLGTCS